MAGSWPDRAWHSLISLLTGKPLPRGEEKAMLWLTMLVPSRRNALLMVIGTLLYGLTAWVTNSFPMSAGAGISLRPGVAVPLFFGFAFGPVVGFVTGLGGNLLGDAVMGWLVYPPEHSSGSALVDVILGYSLSWQVGNGLLGLIAGVYALFCHRYRTVREQLRALGITVLAVVVGMGFASFVSMALTPGTGFLETVTGTFLPVTWSNLFNAVVVVPLLLFNYERLDLRSTEWTRSGLLRRIVLAILISALLPVALLGLFLTQQAATAGAAGAANTTELTVKLLFTTAATLLLAVSNASLVALSISRPLLRLTGAAEAMEANKFTPEQATALRDAPGDDEVSHLSQLFGKMAAEVIQREQSLRHEVQQLRIEIDEAKKLREVSEVTDNEYFRELQTRVRELRLRDRRQVAALN
jgi:energy-coupling factor transport system substrate-specific component